MYEDAKKRIGPTIKNARLAKKLTRTELAEMVGIGVNHLKRLELSYVYTSLELLFTLAKVLEFSLDSLVFENLDGESETKKTLINLINSSEEWQLNIVLATLRATYKDK